MSDTELYEGREQTLIKHFILRKYLERFALIIGSRWDAISYVDCFSGPWKSQSQSLEDTSFAIALHELKKARDAHAERGKRLQLRCMFLERDGAAYAKLKEFAGKVSDVVVETRNSDLAGAVEDVLRFVRGGAQSSFSFFFIDPTGWTGFGMDLISPLLRHEPGEVLINFMTDFIRRFIDHPDQHTREQFANLFGPEEVRRGLQLLSDPGDREDALIGAYAEHVRKAGGFTHVCRAVILYPEIDRSYFHLIYATRNRKGVEVFKQVERKAMEIQDQQRSHAKQRKQTKKTGQKGLFSPLEMPQTRPIDALRQRYLAAAKAAVEDRLRCGRAVPFETIWDLALSFPLLWESDLKEWIRQWAAEGVLEIEGMGSRQRVPKLGAGNQLAWLDHSR